MNLRSSPSILLVGNTDRSEFRQARADIEGAGLVVAAPDVSSALSILAKTEIEPGLIVLAQGYPGEFSPAEVDRLRRAAPLARVLGLLGSWCEGEIRTGHPWPGAIRVYWHQWQASFQREFHWLRGGETSTWSLPATASEEERLLALPPLVPTTLRGDEAPSRSVKGGHDEPALVTISTPWFDSYDWLASACARRDYRAIWFRPRSVLPPCPVAIAIFDAPDDPEQQRASLELLVAATGSAPIVALADFPRARDRDRLLALGTAAVLSKPFLIADLFWEIERLLAVDMRRPGRAGSPLPV